MQFDLQPGDTLEQLDPEREGGPLSHTVLAARVVQETWYQVLTEDQEGRWAVFYLSETVAPDTWEAFEGPGSDTMVLTRTQRGSDTGRGAA